jgi:hypothetical protein
MKRIVAVAIVVAALSGSVTAYARDRITVEQKIAARIKVFSLA